jgi:uncharacterized protein YndB with AHSA1/START domain
VSRIREVVEVDAPPEKVWEVVADPRHLPKWDRRIVSVHDVPPDGLKVGSTYRTEIGLMGLRGRVDAVVHEIEPHEYAEIELSGVPLRATVRTRLTPLDGGKRTRLEQDVEYHVRGGPLGEVLGRALAHLGASAILRRGVLAQKRHAEGRDPAGDEGW